MSINLVVLEGRLVKDSEHSVAGTGTEITKFRIAHNEWNKRDQKEEAKFFSVKVFKNMPLAKGTPIMVKGKLDQFQFTADDGQNKDFTYVIGFEVFPFYVKKPESNTQVATKVFDGEVQPAKPTSIYEDDIPF